MLLNHVWLDKQLMQAVNARRYVHLMSCGISFNAQLDSMSLLDVHYFIGQHYVMCGQDGIVLSDKHAVPYGNVWHYCIDTKYTGGQSQKSPHEAGFLRG